jgi:hypothetical protein
MTTETTKKLTVILDPVGRTIVGEETTSPKGHLSIKNPVILHIVPADNQGKMSVQLLPLFFREFLADKSSDVTFTYDATKIAKTDIDALDFRLQAQYSQMFNPNNQFVTNDQPVQEDNANNDSTVINLFDNE